MKKIVFKVIFSCAAVCLLTIGFLYVNNDIGVPILRLEDDVRASCHIIKEDWIVEGSVSDVMAAFIAYSPDKSDHTYSVYVNRPGFSFGYFFREGGNIIDIKEIHPRGDYRIRRNSVFF